MSHIDCAITELEAAIRAIEEAHNRTHSAIQEARLDRSTTSVLLQRALHDELTKIDPIKRELKQLALIISKQ